ncbi:EDD domain protein, DegV family [Desulfosporosinus orientis DSM 765]|uniref:EDD domain protein, DegV family n=1 Tax=Desulfosporosinus orientis (strain ATCC 19365 / DSM 765 / NCIMB 8382 / VKM B-1628 / Singapore I) TaxID=768706 RepID=G7WAF4_DESOD|nr:DegV family protein [Desulfosporosinus orientis]AET66503.1 EDD domain protein, DegV family [Desulfosporosinus orientis DSM 765]
MKRIALVTDSTADLTEHVRRDCNIHVIPLKVRFGEREYMDGELSSEEFYQRLNEGVILPKTSQPTPEEFSRLYSKLLEEYHEIISVHISTALSGTFNAANLAKEKFKEKIHLVDSKSISLGAGLMVMEVAKYIKEGQDVEGILENIKKARKNIETLFTLNTLEYLQKGGRIGKVQGFMGSLLNIKPIIRVGDDGVYHTYGKAHSQKKAIDCVVQAFQDLTKDRKPIRLAVAHGAAHKAGTYLKEALEFAFQLPTTVFTQVGPVIGVHTGPGTVGAAVQYE